MSDDQIRRVAQALLDKVDDAREAEIARLLGVLREIRTRPPSEAYEIARFALANKETDDEG